MSEPLKTEAGLRRDISRLGFAALSLNGVIGAGIFALPAVAAAAAGLFSPWLFVLCGLLIMTVVLSFARAASFFSDTGGPLAYVGHAFGPFAGFQTGWLYTFARVTSLAANTNLLVTYMGWFWEPLGTGVVRQMTITAVTVFLVAVNVIGVRRGVLAIFVFTLLKLIPLSLLVLVGLTKLEFGIFSAAGLPVFEGAGETVLVLLYAFVGFEGAVVPAGEARNPRRDIPRALISSVLAVTVLYVLIQWVAISVEPGIGSSETPLIDVANILMGTAGAVLIAAGAVFSISGNLSSMLLSGPRMVYAMGRSHLLPRWFHDVSARFGTPANSILFVGALGLALALSGSFVWLAAMSTVVRLLVYAACIAALPRLQRTPPGQEDVFRLPGGYLIPVIALLLCGWLITHATLESWLITGLFMAVGSVFYLASAHRRRPQSRREPPGA